MFCLKQDKDGLKTLQSVRFGMTDTALFDKMFFFPLGTVRFKDTDGKEGCGGPRVGRLLGGKEVELNTDCLLFRRLESG
jgi:hypothetical protein